MESWRVKKDKVALKEVKKEELAKEKERKRQEKAAEEQKLKKITYFLKKRKYDMQFIPNFQTINSKGFLKLFQMLQKEIDPSSSAVRGNVCTEIPRHLEKLQCPTPVRRNVSGPGPPGNWEGLLDSVLWLVELLKFKKVLEKKGRSVAAQILRDYDNNIGKAYRYYLTNHVG